MIMANGSPSYGWPFDDDVNGFDVTAVGDEHEDFVSLFNTIGEKSRGDYSENGPANPSSSTASCNGSSSYWANEHYETHNSSLAIPFLNDSEASVSNSFYQSNLSVNQLHGSNSEITNFNDTIADWSMSVPADFTQDFLSINTRATEETSFEGAYISDAFGFTNGSYDNYQQMDSNGMINELFNSSVRNNHQTFDPPLMNLYREYSDCITGINEPLYIGTSSSNHNDGYLYNVNIESEEHLMQNSSRNLAVRYETLVERPGGVALVDRNFDVGESTSGYHEIRMCNLSNKKELVCVKNEKHGPTPCLTRKKRSSTNRKPKGTHPTNIRKKEELKTLDENSTGLQFQSQELPCQKSKSPLTDNGLSVPLLKHQV